MKSNFIPREKGFYDKVYKEIEDIEKHSMIPIITLSIIIMLIILISIIVSWFPAILTILKLTRNTYDTILMFIGITLFPIFLIFSFKWGKYIYKERVCPFCNSKMEKIFPEQDDYLNNYYYICNNCYIYIDIKYKNSND